KFAIVEGPAISRSCRKGQVWRDAGAAAPASGALGRGRGGLRDPTRGDLMDSDGGIPARGRPCGRVRFTVTAPTVLQVDECNCSICAKTGYLHLIVPRSRFQLEKGQDELTAYRFNTGTAEHLFCRTCGIKSFYVPRSHPEGVSVN